MAKYSLDYNGVAESTGEFEPLPEGEYEVCIDKVEETQTKQTGRPMIKVLYKVMKPKEHEGRILFDQVVLVEAGAKGAGMTKHFLHVIDEPYEGNFEVDPDHWVGKSLKVSVTVTEDGKYNNVKSRAVADLPF